MRRSSQSNSVPAYVADFSGQILAVAIRGVDSDLLPDAALARAARVALARRHGVLQGKVTATVRHGWLTLEGDVSESFQKEEAHRAVAALHGLHGVTNNVVVESDRLALQVQQKLAEAFIDNRALRADHILVTIHDHMAILTGVAESETERTEATAAASAVAGIAAVVNQIRVDAT
ncbi:MAG: BON domain-containing protein [Rhodopila sp.]